MVLESTPTQEAQAKALQLPVPSVDLLRNRVDPLEIISAQEKVRIAQSLVGPKQGVTESALPTFYETPSLEGSDANVDLTTNATFYSQGLDIWGIDVYAEARLTMVPGPGGCMPPQGCGLVVYGYLFTYDLSIPGINATTWITTAYSMVPIQNPYAIASRVGLFTESRPLLTYHNKLVGVLIVGVVFSAIGINCTRIHGHFIWPDAPSPFVTPGQGC